MSLKELRGKPWARAVIVITAPIWVPVTAVLGIFVLIVGSVSIEIAGLFQAVYNYIQKGKFESELWKNI